MSDRAPTIAPRTSTGDRSVPARLDGLGLVHRAIAGLALLALMRLAAPLLVPIAAAGVLWLLLGPVAIWLERRGVPAFIGAAVLSFVPPALLGGAALLALPASIDAIEAVATSSRHLVDLLAPMASRGGSQGVAAQWLVAHLAWNGDTALDGLRAGAPEAALETVSALMLLFFMLLAQRSLGPGVLRALRDPADAQRVVEGVEEARRGVVAFIGVMGLMNALLAAATGIALAAIGLSHAAFWAVLCFALVFVPYLGPLAVAVLLLVAGAEAFGARISMFAPAVAFLGLHAVEANLLSPWLMGNRLRLGRPALLVSVMAGAWVWGVVGGLLGVPLLIVLAALVRRLPGATLPSALLAAEDAVDRDVAPALAPNVTALGARSLRSAARAHRLPDSGRTFRPMRIAFVTETYPPEINGVALTVARAVGHLRAQGHEVDLIRPRQQGEKRGSGAADGEWRRFGLSDSGLSGDALRPGPPGDARQAFSRDRCRSGARRDGRAARLGGGRGGEPARGARHLGLPHQLSPIQQVLPARLARTGDRRVPAAVAQPHRVQLRADAGRRVANSAPRASSGSNLPAAASTSSVSRQRGATPACGPDGA